MVTPSEVTEARIRAKLRPGELAVKAGVGYRTIYRAERGQRIDPVSQQKIAEALGLERTELFAEGAVA